MLACLQTGRRSDQRLDDHGEKSTNTPLSLAVVLLGWVALGGGGGVRSTGGRSRRRTAAVGKSQESR